MTARLWNPSYALVLLFITGMAIVLLRQDLPAQGARPWNGKACAVALTYDDALNVHLDKVVPLLDSLGFKATFYVAGSFPGFKSRVRDWAAIAARGHELGNHSMFHPCEGGTPGREWVAPDYDLHKYTVRRMVDEIEAQNTLLEALDGGKPRTFAYPCGDTLAGGSTYVPAIRKDFLGARGVQARFEKLTEVDVFDIGSFMIQGQTGPQLIQLVKDALARQALIVFLFHGVGGEHSINVSLESHRALVMYLKEHENDIWVAPLSDIAGYITAHR